MRIGLSIEHFRPQSGGAEQWTYQFARELIVRGHEVHVVAQTFASETEGLPIVAHPLGTIGSRTALAGAMGQKLHSLALDVIHDMGGGWYCDVFLPHSGSRRAALERNLELLPAWLRPAKRGLWSLLPRYREFERLARRQFVDDGRLFVALSKRVADDFQRFHGVPRERIRLVYNGVDAVRFAPQPWPDKRSAVRQQLGLDEETLLALIVAHNFRLKGVPSLLAAMARMRQRRVPVHLVVAGGKRTGAFLRRTAAMGLAGAVTFTGIVSDPLPLYVAADVYVHPTYYDPCSLVVLEAMACGLPAITTQYNGVSELMTAGREGFVLEEPTHVDVLVQHLEALCDPALRQRMGQAARQLALEHTFTRNVQELLDVYAEVAPPRRAAA